MVARSRSDPPLNLMALALRLGLSEDLEEERAEPLPDFLVLVPMVFLMEERRGGVCWWWWVVVAFCWVVAVG